MSYPDYRDPRDLARSLKNLLWAHFALTLVSLAVTYVDSQQWEMVQRGEAVSQRAAAMVETAVVAQAVFAILVFLGTVVLFCKFSYRIVANAHRLAPGKPDASPRMAAVTFFIPIVNLFGPYQALASAYRAIGGPERNPNGIGVISTWWVVWLLTNLVGRISSRMIWDAETIDEVLEANRMSLLADCIDLVACVFAVLAINTLVRACVERREQMPAEPPPVPASEPSY